MRLSLTPSLLLLASLLTIFGCDSAGSDGAFKQDDTSLFAANASMSVVADGEVFVDTEMANNNGRSFQASLQTLVGEPFPGNAAEYFTVEGIIAETTSGTIFGEIPEFACETKLRSLASSGNSSKVIMVEDNDRQRFVAFIPRQFVDEIAQRDIEVERTCTGEGVTLVVTGIIEPNGASSSTTDTFPSMTPGVPLSGTHNAVFSDTDTDGTTTLDAVAESAVYTNTGVPYTLVDSELSSVPANEEYTCRSVLEKEGSNPSGLRVAEIELTDNTLAFTPFIPSDLNQLLTNANIDKITFRRTCEIGSTGHGGNGRLSNSTLEISGELL